MNKKGLFGVLNDGAGAGVGIDKVEPGTTTAASVTNTLAAPVFQNSSGVLVFPSLDANGKIQVAFDSGTCLNGYAKVTGSTSFQDLGSVTLTLTELYNKIGYSIASATEACYELVYIDDDGGSPTETILATLMTGPGQYSFCCELSCLEVDTTGGTGTQTLKLRGKLLETTGSEIAGTVAALQNA